MPALRFTDKIPADRIYPLEFLHICLLLFIRAKLNDLFDVDCTVKQTKSIETKRKRIERKGEMTQIRSHFI